MCVVCQLNQQTSLQTKGLRVEFVLRVVGGGLETAAGDTRRQACVVHGMDPCSSRWCLLPRMLPQVNQVSNSGERVEGYTAVRDTAAHVLRSSLCLWKFPREEIYHIYRRFGWIWPKGNRIVPVPVSGGRGVHHGPRNVEQRK